MRTNIDIDGDLVAEAMRLTGLPTKKATVEEALRRIVRAEHLRAVIRDSAGIGWEGDPEETRLGWDRPPPP